MKKKLPLDQTLKISDSLARIEEVLHRGSLTTLHAGLFDKLEARIRDLQRKKFIIVEPVLERMRRCSREIGQQRVKGPLPTMDQWITSRLEALPPAITDQFRDLMRARSADQDISKARDEFLAAISALPEDLRDKSLMELRALRLDLGEKIPKVDLL